MSRVIKISFPVFEALRQYDSCMETMQKNECDSRLIREFVLERSESAFTALVQRHMNLVFGVAMRATSNRSASEEISQNVFMELAKKAMWLQNRESLAAWLHRATLLESKQWWRSECRRKAREETAANLETTMKTNADDTPACSSMLDEALLQLRDGDRQAVLLRFFEGLNNREIATVLGIGEDAARKRVDKALDVMTSFFRKRGYSTGSSAVVISLLAAGAHTASSGLASSVAQVVLARSMAISTGFSGAWLGRFLGMNRVQLAWICAVLLIGPVLWQQARLKSVREEQSRLSIILASVNSQQVELSQQQADIQLQTQQLSNSLASIRFTKMNPNVTGSNRFSNLDPRLFYWNETSSAVRLPKSMFKAICFDGSNCSWYVGAFSHPESVIGKAGQLSPTLLQALGLAGEEQVRLQQYMASAVQKYKQFSESQAVVGGLDLLPSNPPAFLVTNSDTRVWVIPNLSEKVQNWKHQFLSGVASLIGEERSQVILQQASQDGSLSRVFENFGETTPVIVLTPLSDGGCYVSRSIPNYGDPKWVGNYRVPISNIIQPDDAKNDNQIERFIGRPIPAALANYLREWRLIHSETRNTPTKQ